MKKLLWMTWNLLLVAAVGWLALRVSALEGRAPSEREAGLPDEISVAEINTERINILGPNGNPVIVLAGRQRIPGPSMDGKSYSRELIESRPYVSGVIFFNDQGDEVGGLVFNGFETENGGSAIGHLSFDQWKQNQVIALQYNRRRGSQRAGLNVWQRPEDRSMREQLDLMEVLSREDLTDDERAAVQADWERFRDEGGHGVHRLFVGDDNGEVGLVLNDEGGKPRVRLAIDTGGVPFLAFLDEQGGVVSCLPNRGDCDGT
ncbi:MAG: hypothetical protein K8J08_12885 [Thermoanaerobaculia bacterium]|nr:hypothetical protein [Thermoanaerobaculia bacterium]